MAGDWIKIQHALPDKPEVVQIANILGIDQDAVTGKLVRLWVWADQQSVDGHALSVTEMFLDRYVYHAGFATALRQVGWLDGESGNLTLPNFDRHNGNTAKKRALSANRQQASRSKGDTRNAGSVTKAQPEKRREEKSINYIYTPGPSVVVPERLNTTEMREAFGRWVQHVNSDDSDHKRIEPDSPQEQSTWRMIAGWDCSPESAAQAIDAAIAGQWRNLRRPESNGAPRRGKSAKEYII